MSRPPSPKAWTWTSNSAWLSSTAACGLPVSTSACTGQCLHEQPNHPYPGDIHVTGHPAHRGVADLTLVVDTNDVHDTHVILTTDLLLDLYRRIGAKVSELPIRLVTEEISQ